MSEWSGRRVVILGVARQGIALARYLAQHGAQVLLNDQRPLNELQAAQSALADLEGGIEYPLLWVCGGHPLEVLDRVDLLFVSGGVPLTLPVVIEARKRGIPLSNDSQIFLERVGCRVIGISGSAGKTTTTTLVGRMAEQSVRADGPPGTFRRVWVGGNIGTPLISVLDQISTKDLVVMELSSFQLELMTRSPQVAAVLNITPNHLDRHGSMAAYTAAKARIMAYQSPADIAVLGREDPGAWHLADRVRGRMITFGLSETQPKGSSADVFIRDNDLYCRSAGENVWLMSRSAIGLRGEHNLLNALAACAISLAAGIPAGVLEAGVGGFTGVPHRLEFVRSWGGVDWYNDSIATTPERAIAAIRSFAEPLVLLLGGRDKDLSWDELAALALERVDHLVIFGEASEKIIQAVTGEAELKGVELKSSKLVHCTGMRQAVDAASRIVRPGDVVLLSPGGTSFDEFSDFEERGECFRQLVMQL